MPESSQWSMDRGGLGEYNEALWVVDDQSPEIKGGDIVFAVGTGHPGVPFLQV